MRNLILLLVLLVVVISGSKAEPKKARFCGKHLEKTMELVCAQKAAQSGALKKRSFYSSANKRDQYDLWRKVFNINDNTSVTLPEVEFQMNLLFSRCDEYSKQANLKYLLQLYREREHKRNLNREYTNDLLVNSKYLTNYEPSDEESLKELASNSLQRFRRETGIYEECCLPVDGCTLGQLQAYCHID